MREEEGGALIWESEGGEGWLLFKKVKEEEAAYLKLWWGGGCLFREGAYQNMGIYSRKYSNYQK